ncbi:MAG: aa3-type cytochrome c oxidase subunit IV [Pseudomonadota bacterium]
MTENNEKAQPENVMDYPEHEKTYEMFLQGSKLLTLICVTLLVAMAFGFFGGAGLLGGTITFVVLTIVGYFFI